MASTGPCRCRVLLARGQLIYAEHGMFVRQLLFLHICYVALQAQCEGFAVYDFELT